MRLGKGFFLITILLIFSIQIWAQTILVVETMPVPTIEQHKTVFLETLAAADPSGPYTIIQFQADGDFQKAAEFLRTQQSIAKPDLVVTFATLATQAAVSVFGPESGVPVIFAVVVDPVGAGIVREMGVPSGTNVSGVVYTVDRKIKIATALELLASAPGFSSVRVGIAHSSYQSARDDVALLRKAGQAFPRFQIVDGEFPYLPVPSGIPAMREQLAQVVRTLEPVVDWWWEAVGPMSERPKSVADILEVSSKPVLLATHPDGVADGALLSIAPDPIASGRRLAGMALEILAGAKPGDLPVLPAPDFESAVNLGTARRYGLVIPPYLLELAGRHVYQ